ncbi:hypothetical protein Tco_0793145 [Tanacetum coccineum]
MPGKLKLFHQAVSSDVAELKDICPSIALDKKEPSFMLQVQPAPVKSIAGQGNYMVTQLQPREDLKGIIPEAGVCISGPQFPTSSVVKPNTRVWEKLSLPDLTPTCMTLELADRSISKPMGIAKDISVKVSVFHFPADFVVEVEAIHLQFGSDFEISANYTHHDGKARLSSLIWLVRNTIKMFLVLVLSSRGKFHSVFLISIVATSSSTLTPLGGITGNLYHKILMEEGLCSSSPTSKNSRFNDVCCNFHDMVEKTMEVLWMSSRGLWDFFLNCSLPFRPMLQRCEDTNLVLTGKRAIFASKRALSRPVIFIRKGLRLTKQIDVHCKITSSTTVQGIGVFPVMRVLPLGFIRISQKYPDQ